MKKVIINENQTSRLMENLIIEADVENQGISMVTQNLDQKFNKFKTQYAEQIQNTNKIIDMSQLIEEMKVFLKNNVSNVIGTNEDSNSFLTKYYDFLYNKFGELAGQLGWGKKKLVKTVLGKEDKARETIDTWKFKDIIWVLLHLGNLGGDIDPQWGENYKKLVISNKQNLYEKVRDLLLSKIYS